MKDKIKCLIEFVTFISIVIVFLFVLGNIFTPKWTNGPVGEGTIHGIKGFYNLEPNTIDVMFLGSSGTRSAISPMKIYEKTGISSYVYCVTTARTYMYYYLMQDILKTQKPKVVMTDVLTLFYEEKEAEPSQRKSFDYMPLSVNKINMINDDVFEADFFEKVSYVFPIFRYHTRYNKLKDIDFELARNDLHAVQKGYSISRRVRGHKKGYNYMKPKEEKVSLEIKSWNMEYLVKYIELCKKNNIELVILGIPDSKVWSYEQSEKMKELALKYDFKFLDLNDPSIGIDWTKETSDRGGHLNNKGARKTTKAVTDYLKNNYDLPDHRNDPKYKSWNDDLIKYNETIKELIK